jgi:hypothetical protein
MKPKILSRDREFPDAKRLIHSVSRRDRYANTSCGLLMLPDMKGTDGREYVTCKKCQKMRYRIGGTK